MSTQITASSGDSEPRRKSSGGFFSIYKAGQGYWTRLGTAIGAAAVILFIGYFVFIETSVFTQLSSSSRRYAVSAAVVAVLAGVAWWLLNTPKHAQFIIDTDSELKKVNWATWGELAGSTRVVVFFMLLTAFTLFIFDTQFHAFFFGLGVWQIPFAAGAGIATGFVLALILIAVGAGLLRGGETKASKISGTITLIAGVAALVAWIMFTVHTMNAPPEVVVPA